MYWLSISTVMTLRWLSIFQKDKWNAAISNEDKYI